MKNGVTRAGTTRGCVSGSRKKKNISKGPVKRRMEMIGMAVALHLLCGKSLRDLAFNIRNNAFQIIQIVGRYIRKPWLLISVLFAVIAAWLVSVAMPLVETEADKERKRLKEEVANSETYAEWLRHSKLLAKIERSLNGDKEEEMIYDKELIESRVKHLRAVRERGDVREMMFQLRADLTRNLGNISSGKLESSHMEMPGPIQDYLEETTRQLRIITEKELDGYPIEKKLSFLQETRHAFGRTALVLSGGGSFGTFHIGLIKVLVEHHLVPRVISGSSVGSIVTSFVGTRTWEEVKKTFAQFEENPERLGFFSGTSLRQLLGHFVTSGSLHDSNILQSRLREELGNLTFQEAYDVSGRILCITVTPTRKNEEPRLLSYLTSPHVLVWSAVAASCAFPGLFPPQLLYAKDPDGNTVPYYGDDEESNGKENRYWRDGSLEDDLPLNRLSELFNANYFIVSQVNPHIIPVLQAKSKLRSMGKVSERVFNLLESEWKHRVSQIKEILGERGRMMNMISQRWEGDLTLVMPATMEQYRRIIFNPSKQEYYNSLRQGELCAWPKLHVIDANSRIELCLDDCVAQLKSKLKSRFSPGGRVPSWNALSLDNYPEGCQFANRTQRNFPVMEEILTSDEEEQNLNEALLSNAAEEVEHLNEVTLKSPSFTFSPSKTTANLRIDI